MNSRRKGKNGELEAKEALKVLLGLEDAKRAAQVSGKEAADVLTKAEVHWEVKRRKSIAAMAFLEQAERDAESTGKVPVVLMREDRGTEWCLMLRLKDFRSLLDAINEQEKRASDSRGVHPRVADGHELQGDHGEDGHDQG